MAKSPELDMSIREKILDAAAAAFTRRGFSKTTMDDIAKSVGATKGLIYYHFPSKFDIYLGGYELGMNKVKQAVEPMADQGGSGLECLRQMSIAHVRNLMINPKYHHLIHQGVRDQASESMTVRQRESLMELNQLRKDYELMFRGIIEDGVADGSLRAVDPVLATRVLLSSLNAVDMWYREMDDQSEDKIQAMAEGVVDLVIGGVQAH
ncbi:TetR/AcrR family transcriptional regulator [Glutamicibacter ardleyensis]|uniref:TetR family transcriptional regulator n=1 Tax=Glutamicibacter ardleyensis TaxID=225894 RepID=A0ABQ2D987_9MICC|nr:TetR/AcrR family transcriptional regulator [Glutamicibacter ardleyensis]GGJ49698.1 TetR family transcriptional regulator [Glutamicibacter ardleyensis]